MQHSKMSDHVFTSLMIPRPLQNTMPVIKLSKTCVKFIIWGNLKFPSKCNRNKGIVETFIDWFEIGRFWQRAIFFIDGVSHKILSTSWVGIVGMHRNIVSLLHTNIWCNSVCLQCLFKNNNYYYCYCKQKEKSILHVPFKRACKTFDRRKRKFWALFVLTVLVSTK